MCCSKTRPRPIAAIRNMVAVAKGGRRTSAPLVLIVELQGSRGRGSLLRLTSIFFGGYRNHLDFSRPGESEVAPCCRWRIRIDTRGPARLESIPVTHTSPIRDPTSSGSFRGQCSGPLPCAYFETESAVCCPLCGAYTVRGGFRPFGGQAELVFDSQRQLRPQKAHVQTPFFLQDKAAAPMEDHLW